MMDTKANFVAQRLEDEKIASGTLMKFNKMPNSNMAPTAWLALTVKEVYDAS